MNKIFIALIIIIAFSQTAFARGGSFSGGGRGGFSSSRSFSSPSRSYSAPSRSITTTTTTRSYGGYRGSPYYGGYHPMMYPGFGMGYGYSNGILTGLIIGNMMHPQGTVVYTGGGYGGGQALLYPDGRVVNQSGYQVGIYQNGQFTAQAGGMVAQQAPADGLQQAQPINVGYSAWDVIGIVFAIVIIVVIICAIVA